MGSKKLELFFFTQCPYCQLVLSKIDALNIKDKIVFKNTREDQSNLEFHMQKTGRSTVPCLYIEGEPMFESQDIVDWLEQNHKEL